MTRKYEKEPYLEAERKEDAYYREKRREYLKQKGIKEKKDQVLVDIVRQRTNGKLSVNVSRGSGWTNRENKKTAKASGIYIHSLKELKWLAEQLFLIEIQNRPKRLPKRPE